LHEPPKLRQRSLQKRRLLIDACFASSVVQGGVSVPAQITWENQRCFGVLCAERNFISPTVVRGGRMSPRWIRKISICFVSNAVMVLTLRNTVRNLWKKKNNSD
jgi:hypothetical protein